MADGVRDHSAAIDERDVVGNAQDPAGFRAVDQSYLYLRLRVEEDPTQAGQLRRFAWGFAFSITGALNVPQIFVTLDGIGQQVGVYRNSQFSIATSPTDPADTPPVVTYPFATYGRVAVTTGSNFGGDGDFFIDMAVPWSQLSLLGLSQDTPIVVWAASSSAADRLDGDFACHDSNGGAGAPDLDGAASGSTTASGSSSPGGSGGSGGGASGPSGVSLEGGPSCAYSEVPPPAAWPAWLLLISLLCLLGRPRH